jgi:hypothetical protein
MLLLSTQLLGDSSFVMQIGRDKKQDTFFGIRKKALKKNRHQNVVKITGGLPAGR